MNWLDIVIAIILLVSIFIGLKIGLIKAILSLVGLILGIFLAGRFYESFAGVLTFLPDTAARVVAFILIILVVMIIITIIAALLDKLLSAIMLGWVNHLGGAVFGLLMGGMFCGAVLAVWVAYIGGSDVVSSSALGTFLVNGFPLVLALLPSKFDSIKNLIQ